MGFLLVSKILKFLELQHVTLILMDLLKLFLQNMKASDEAECASEEMINGVPLSRKR